MVYDYNLIFFLEAEERGSRFQIQPGIYTETLSSETKIKNSQIDPHQITKQNNNKHPAKHTNSYPSHPRDHTLKIPMAVSQLD